MVDLALPLPPSPPADFIFLLAPVATGWPVPPSPPPSPRPMTDAQPQTILPQFAPVPREKDRHNGWKPEVQRAFIEALAETGMRVWPDESDKEETRA